jgi:hypothetical protein
MRLRLRHFLFAWVCAAALGWGACGSVASRNDAGTGGASGSVGGAVGSLGGSTGTGGANGAGGTPADAGSNDGGSTATIFYRGGIEAVSPIAAPAGATVQIVNAGLRYPRTRVCNASTCLSGGIIP